MRSGSRAIWSRRIGKCGANGAMATDSADSLIAEGNRAEDAGDLARACELYRRAASLPPPPAKAPLHLRRRLAAGGAAARPPAPAGRKPARHPAQPAAP